MKNARQNRDWYRSDPGYEYRTEDRARARRLAAGRARRTTGRRAVRRARQHR